MSHTGLGKFDEFVARWWMDFVLLYTVYRRFAWPSKGNTMDTTQSHFGYASDARGALKEQCARSPASTPARLAARKLNARRLALLSGRPVEKKQQG